MMVYFICYYDSFTSKHVINLQIPDQGLSPTCQMYCTRSRGTYVSNKVSSYTLSLLGVSQDGYAHFFALKNALLLKVDSCMHES
jgi:hypothetical protein